jgi:hypothetical protein
MPSARQVAHFQHLDHPDGPRPAGRNPPRQASGRVGDWRGFVRYGPFPVPPVKPCVRFSRTRLTDAVHRRHSVFPRQSRRGLGATTVPSRLIRPIRFGDRSSCLRPIARLAGGCPSWTARSRAAGGVVPDLAEDPGGVAVAEVSSPTAQEQVEVLTMSSTGIHSHFRPVISRIRSRARWTALRAGQRARKVRCADFGVRPRTSRW